MPSAEGTGPGAAPPAGGGPSGSTPPLPAPASSADRRSPGSRGTARAGSSRQEAPRLTSATASVAPPNDRTTIGGIGTTNRTSPIVPPVNGPQTIPIPRGPKGGDYWSAPSGDRRTLRRSRGPAEHRGPHPQRRG